jgi:transposase-like protein
MESKSVFTFVSPHKLFLGINRGVIEKFVSLLRIRNQHLSIEKSELLAEVVHNSYNSLLLLALRSDCDRRQKLYQELRDLLVNYLKPYAGDDFLLSALPKNQTSHNKVMICPFCHSERLSKNGHRYGKQRYLCKDCGKQFPETYNSRGYGEEIRQKCLNLHIHGMNYREIERITGVSHNTVINWVKRSQGLSSINNNS